MEAKTASQVGEVLVRSLRVAYIDQGHNNTGRGAASIAAVTTTEAGVTRVTVWALDYVALTNTGVTHDKIPYSPSSGAKSSKYILGLMGYVKSRLPGTSDADALQIAFRIAHVQKIRREGMSTIASKKYSKTGKRLGWVAVAYEAAKPEILRLIGSAIVDGAKFELSKISGR